MLKCPPDQRSALAGRSPCRRDPAGVCARAAPSHRDETLVRVPSLRGLHRLSRRRAHQRLHFPGLRSVRKVCHDDRGSGARMPPGPTPRGLHPTQCSAQCGFCTLGMLLACKALLQAYPKPTREQSGRYLNGNICRCGAYVQILEAIQDVVEARQSDASGLPGPPQGGHTSPDAVQATQPCEYCTSALTPSSRNSKKDT